MDRFTLVLYYYYSLAGIIVQGILLRSRNVKRLSILGLGFSHLFRAADYRDNPSQKKTQSQDILLQHDNDRPFFLIFNQYCQH